jgi:hypothetical protein
LPSKPIDYEYQAALADLITIVKARFIEAADTIAHMDVGRLGPAQAQTYWPAMQLCSEQEKTADGGRKKLRYMPSKEAIARSEDVLFNWLVVHVADDESRVLLGRWASCQATPWIAGSFRAFCKKNCLSRSTAERRVDKALKDVATAVLKNAKSLQGPNWSRVMPMMPNQRIDLGKMATVTSWMGPDARPRNMPETHIAAPRTV